MSADDATDGVKPKRSRSTGRVRRRSSSGSSPERQADRVYQALKDKLYLATWALPGERLTEHGLAEYFGTSRVPVREALRHLVQERYLWAHFRNGYTVRAFSARTFQELNEVRITLECQALHWAAKRPRTEHDEACLHQLKQAWAAPEQKTTVEHLARLNREFHAALVALSGNEELARVHGDVIERVEVVQRLDFTQYDRIESTYREHRAVLDALASGDDGSAAQELTSHIRHSTEEVRKRMQTRFDSDY